MKLLHTADIHLGTSTYGRIDSKTGLNTRLLDFKRSFDFMVERALAEDIDAFLFTGDAYRTPDPSPTQQKVFAECLRPLSEAGIPIVMIVGNHDHPVSFGKASSIDIFHFVSGDVHLFRRPDRTVIDTKSGPLQLVALPWPIRSKILSREKHRKKSPEEVRAFIEEKYVQFTEQAVRELDPSLPAVLAGHLTVQGARLAGSERTSLIAHEPTFTSGQLAVPPIDYVALGHIHGYQDRHEGAHPPIVYCGSIERVSFNEQNDPKGFVLVQIETKDGRKQTDFTFVETPARPFLSVQVDARGAEAPTERIIHAIEQESLEEAIVRIRYRIDESQESQVDVRQIRAALDSAHVIAAIERVVDPAERRQRTVVTRDANLEDALRKYIAQHDHLASVEENMVKAALELETEYDNERRN